MPTTQPDLIELATDWDNALLVADRYTGPGGAPKGDAYFTEQGKRVLAAMLLIANKEGHGYGWIDELLGQRDYMVIGLAVADLRKRRVAIDSVPLRVLDNVHFSAKDERSAIYSIAYLMFTKALQPRSALPPGLFDDGSPASQPEA
jgi:hypothetical protein